MTAAKCDHLRRTRRLVSVVAAGLTLALAASTQAEPMTQYVFGNTKDIDGILVGGGQMFISLGDTSDSGNLDDPSHSNRVLRVPSAAAPAAAF